MKYLKTILAVVGAIAVVLIAFALFSFLYSALWYIVVFGVLVGGGYAGYKLLKKDSEQGQLGEKKPTAIAEMEVHDRTLEEYKRKYLPK